MSINRETGSIHTLKNELTEIRKKNREELRLQKKNAIDEYKQNLIEAQKNMSALIVKIYDKICGDVGTNSSKILMDLASQEKEKLSALGSEASETLENALEQYSKLHDKVGFYYRQYEQKPEELFERCFGKKPEGKVQLILGPMTLCFRCFNENDYIHAYINYKHDDTDSKEIERAKLSQGAAFPECKVSDLSGCIITEKASNNFKYVETIKEKKIEIKKGGKTFIKFSDLNLNNTVFWKIDGKIRYQLSFQTKNGKVSGLNLFDTEKSDFVFYDKPINSVSDERIIFPAEKFKQTEYVDIEVTGVGLTITDHSRKTQVLEYQVPAGIKQVIKDESLSKRVRRHEEQHQFNKLFVPKEESEIRQSLITSLDKISSFNASESESRTAKAKIIQTLARHYRRMYIDFRARDEIIAYYKDGRDIDQIALLLKSNPLYNYKLDELTFDNGKKIIFEKWLEELLAGDLKAGQATQTIRYRKNKSKENFAKKSSLELAVGNYFSIQEIKNQLDSVLTSEYFKSIDQWLEQIKSLEQLGYNRQQIVAFCNMLPARSWKTFVLRLRRQTDKPSPILPKAQVLL